MQPFFKDRRDAGKKLAEALIKYKDKPDTIVLALPRGGVPVAYEVAQALSLPLDVLPVRKLGLPGYEECAMGAIADAEMIYVNRPLLGRLGMSSATISRVLTDALAKARPELAHRKERYRPHKPPLDVKEKTVLLVDDGIATGSTMRAAIGVLHAGNARRIIVAVPVGEASICKEVEMDALGLVCLHTPEHFSSVGEWYQSFPQTSDEEVLKLLGL